MGRHDNTMTEEKIKRINELAALAKQRDLTPAEAAERATLRREYIDSFKASLRGQLDNIVIVEKDGSKTPLKKKDS